MSNVPSTLRNDPKIILLNPIWNILGQLARRVCLEAISLSSSLAGVAFTNGGFPLCREGTAELLPLENFKIEIEMLEMC